MDNIITLLDEACTITDKAKAAECFKKIVSLIEVKHPGQGEFLAKKDIGYFAGYHDEGARERVLELYGAEHPYLPLNPTPQECYDLGREMGARMREEIKIKNEIQNGHG